MIQSILDLGFLVAAVGLIFGLKRQSDPATARSGNLLASYAMALGVIIALIYPIDSETGGGSMTSYLWILISLVLGSLIGYRAAVKVEMTGMPQLVSLFNGLGGLSAVFVGYVELSKLDPNSITYLSAVSSTLFALVVGAISFSGSLLAYFKLDGKIKDSQVSFKGHNILNYILLVVLIGLVWLTVSAGAPDLYVNILLVVSLVYGWSFVAPIGGADMPVVISLLNSLTGLTAAAAGLIYGNQFMLLGGILVGASGTILTVLMCNAMNRSLLSVIAGNFAGSDSGESAGDQGPIRESGPSDVSVLMYYAQKVVIVPGYGLAVAQAQQYVKQIYQILSDNDVKVVFGIHPVAGRMPGHMNVLLAEVDIPYDALLDLEETNEEMASADLALIIGANDVVNPAAVDDEKSSIYGMPVLEVWKAKNVVVMKRSMASGYAGIQNPLFFKPNSQMLFGNAKNTLAEIVQELKKL